VLSPLLTDLYQLTMAYGYWKLNIHDREAVFQQIFRKNPFGGNYAVACGLATVIDFLKDWHFSADDLSYLATLTASDGSVLFPQEFLDYLAQLRFTCDIDAISEGTVVFPHLPLLRIKGPLLQGQLIESSLLNIINFQSLIATKASRVCRAAQGDSVLEFGMRRAQGPDGALSASRAAYIGGCEATSNVLAGKLFGIPVRGTHGHSWVTAFPDERSAFEAYAQVMQKNCVLLVDTYNTHTGIEHAIEIGKKLRAQGSELLGIRLDSGDLAALSIDARQMLDAAGFESTRIVASNSLDEHVIEKLKKNGAQISVWGVGTHLSTGYDQPSLDGVYKLTALRDAAGHWQYKLKLSEQAVKISNPGIYQVRRFFRDGQQLMDVMYDVEMGIGEVPEMMLLDHEAKKIKLSDYDGSADLLVPVFRKGELVYPAEPIQDIRTRALDEVKQFCRAFPQDAYPVGLEKNLYELKQKLITELVAANQSE
jgi:nicotinate phosphoribosyltransferase